MRIYGVDPEVTPVTHDIKCPLCHRGTISVTLRIGESVERICPHCEERIGVQWVFDEPFEWVDLTTPAESGILESKKRDDPA